MRKSLPVRKNERLIGMLVRHTHAWTSLALCLIILIHSLQCEIDQLEDLVDRQAHKIQRYKVYREYMERVLEYSPEVGIFHELCIRGVVEYNIDIKCKTYVYMYLCTCVRMLGMGDKNFMSQYTYSMRALSRYH